MVRLSVSLVMVLCVACATVPPPERPDCPETAMAEWQIPAGWYVRTLTPEEAHEQVLTGNLGVDAIRERWDALFKQYESGGQFWRFERPDEPWVSNLGWQRGVALNSGCRQLGFVTTSMQADDSARSRP